ncbi:spore coat protein [Lottiidibacillus patelloidae]|uniref:Spore coat protein n=1 Tax=Lottiidibacillus patelloidae TaxID=2670334 RepID=A0A263BR26_9BACI|nr:spore coat protein [Lottiidibacillus patelloidae]OZM56160.1 spore coat protein [Lottiidibacillus patelloidae]
MQGQQNGMNSSMQTSPTMPATMRHGGHEVFDVHEVLSTLISTLDQYLLFQEQIQCPELKGILQRQHQFITQTYNTAVDCFTTGQDPTVPTQSYKMLQNNDVIYGLKPAQPQKPAQSVAEINEQTISTSALGLVKSAATLMAMTSLEMTNPVVRRVIADSVPNFIEMSYELFLYMNKKSYYQVPQLTMQDMQMMVTSYTQSQQQMQMPN